MSPDLRVSRVQRLLRIESAGDWHKFSSAQILAVDGAGIVTLNQIRRQLAIQNICLRNDLTPDYWMALLGGAGSAAIAAPFVIAIDNKEQRPWSFAGICSGDGAASRTILVPTQVKSLGTGDYSIVGLEDEIAIERKSLTDLYATLGAGRSRFIRELERLDRFKVAMIIVETEWAAAFSKPPPRSQVPAAAVQGSIIAWSQQFPKIHWWMLPRRSDAEIWAYWQLERFFRRHTASLRLSYSSQAWAASPRSEKPRCGEG